MSINIGTFNQRVTFQTYTETKSSNGEVIRTYADLITVWANVRNLYGSEQMQADEKTAVRGNEFRVRTPGVTIDETSRIVWRGETFNITSIDRFGQQMNEIYIIRGISKDNV
jgi:SPP1 family predicted phage head-tail adaptor